MRGFKRSPIETAKLLEVGLLVDERSFLSLDGHVVLYGADKSAQRARIHARAKGRCQVCRNIAPLDGDEGYAGGWHHIETEAGKHCDCFHNSSWRCGHFVRNCHTKEHAHRRPRFGERAGEAA
jgi:hypothetical protein